ncbi:MAG: TolC family protein [Lentisphaerae bacterium]|nr:TolC family protein [Lentisphaerota bacterium]
MEDLLDLAMKHNPEISAAQGVAERLQALHAYEFGFFDPALSASVSHGKWTQSVPFSSLPGFTDDNSISLKAGINIPLLPGAYFSAGFAEQYLTEPGADFDSIYRTLIGGELWVPLHRDRGLAQWKIGERTAMFRFESAQFKLLAVLQKVRFDIESAFVDLLIRFAAIERTKMATLRAEKLLEEAEALVSLNGVPSSQFYPARMEVGLHLENILAAELAYRTAVSQISTLVGINVANLLNITDNQILNVADKCVFAQEIEIGTILKVRGDYLSAESSVRAAEKDIALVSEQLKSDLGLSVKATWQGEDADNLLGTDLLISNEHLGTEVALVWRKPLKFKAERSELAAQKAQLRTVNAEMHRIRLAIEADFLIAYDSFKSAKERLGATIEAVKEAEGALAAENERFKLGEGTSRSVLDAQKDLTAAISARNNVAGELLKAFVTIRYSTGYQTNVNGDIEESVAR